MIIDIEKFAVSERPSWIELEKTLERLEKEPSLKLTLGEVRRLHYLYERASAGLARIMTFSSEPELHGYLESLVARAYGEVHEVREKGMRFRPWQWLFQTLPVTFRRHIRAFGLSLGVTLAGCGFGWLALELDPEAKDVIMPFSHLQGDPAERVAREERTGKDRLQGRKTEFSAFLMTHNTKVSIKVLALGMTWGVGTMILLFYNGVILGAVALDYVRAGETQFLLGWLLPHGAIEIPAILIAGQAGLVLAGAILGRGARASLAGRLRATSRDLVTLISGAALLLVWAGIVEAFLSQSHEPVLPYELKIGLGCLEITLLCLFLSLSGRRRPEAGLDPPGRRSRLVAR